MVTQTSTTFDAIALEIALHRLWQITEEMAITLTRTSGSVVTIDSKDYMTALYDATGNCVMSGSGVIFHSGVFAHAVQYLMRETAADVGIEDGDVFILNDPYVAPLHQADVSLFTPIFAEGELVGWSVTMTHMVDIGGIDPGGVCPNARTVYQEGLRFQGVKLVERGRMRSDLFQFILNAVRDPGMVGLDLKAQLAAAETARRRVADMVRTYGLGGYHELCARTIQYAEDKFRARLRELPDGTWSSRVYADGGAVTDDIYRVQLAMTKQGDRLEFDFAGTSGQAPLCINTTMHGARGGVFGAVAPLLAFDVPWNQGLLNCFDVRVEEGTLVSARFPAPVSMATTGAAFLVSNAAIIAISQMLGASEQHLDDATAQWSSSSPVVILNGAGRGGQRFVSLLMEGMCGGGGGMHQHDGQDLAGKPWTPQNIHPNAETLESQFPVLYLYRRSVTDSAGAGTWRGGLAGEMAVKVYDNPTGMLEASTMGMGDEALLGHGLFGGYPSHNIHLRIKRDTDIEAWLARGELPANLTHLSGREEQIPPLWSGQLSRDDVINVQWNGGGGFGDPLGRAPELVAEDVRSGAVSREMAEALYGVVVDQVTGTADEQATERRRAEIRRERLGAEPMPATRNGAAPAGQRVGVYLELVSKGHKVRLRCRCCGTELCAADENFKEHVKSGEFPLTRSSPRNSTRGRFVLREFYCRGCATLLEVEVAKRGDPLLHSFRFMG